MGDHQGGASAHQRVQGGLHRALGFRETGPYSSAPTPGAIFFELKLS